MGLDEKVVEYGSVYVWINTVFSYIQYIIEVQLIYAQC